MQGAMRNFSGDGRPRFGGNAGGGQTRHRHPPANIDLIPHPADAPSGREG
jgi:hypothetical protein